MRPGLAKLIEKVHISSYFESPDTDLHVAENTFCVDCDDTLSLKWVHGLSKSQSQPCGTIYYGCDDWLELNTGVALVSLPIMRIHLQVATNYNTLLLLATLHYTEWMDHCQVHRGSLEPILILDPVDVEAAFSHIASRYHSSWGHVQSYGWRYGSYS